MQDKTNTSDLGEIWKNHRKEAQFELTFKDERILTELEVLSVYLFCGSTIPEC